MIDLQATDEFWSVVEECLLEFHQATSVEAVEKSRELRRTLKNAPPGIIAEFIYHDEPFDVACELSGRQLDLGQHQAQYDLILSRHNW